MSGRPPGTTSFAAAAGDNDDLTSALPPFPPPPDKEAEALQRRGEAREIGEQHRERLLLAAGLGLDAAEDEGVARAPGQFKLCGRCGRGFSGPRLDWGVT